MIEVGSLSRVSISFFSIRASLPFASREETAGVGQQVRRQLLLGVPVEQPLRAGPRAGQGRDSRLAGIRRTDPVAGDQSLQHVQGRYQGRVIPAPGFQVMPERLDCREAE